MRRKIKSLFDKQNNKVTPLAIACTALLILSGNTLKAQQQPEFAPIGAEWYYTNTAVIHLDPVYNCEKYTSVKDTFLANYVCKMVAHTRQGNYLNTTIFRQEGGKIYYYFKDTFHLIYDYEATVGDTVTFAFKWGTWGWEPDSLIPVKCVVKDIQVKHIDGEDLRMFSTTIVPDTSYIGYFYISNVNYDYMEKIGHPNVFMEEIRTSIPLMNYTRNLRCYTDAQISYTTDWWADYNLPCDHYGVGIKDASMQTEFLVYPNPFQDRLTIQTDNIAIVAVFDMQGRLLYSNKDRLYQTMDLSFLSDGMYILKITTRENKVIHRKIAKGGRL
jgi:hypothetical protein